LQGTVAAGYFTFSILQCFPPLAADEQFQAAQFDGASICTVGGQSKVVLILKFQRKESIIIVKNI
jgi:hypothetical protein